MAGGQDPAVPLAALFAFSLRLQRRTALVSRSCLLWGQLSRASRVSLEQLSPARTLALQGSDAEGAVCEERHTEGSAQQGFAPRCAVCVSHQGRPFPGRGFPDPSIAVCGHGWAGAGAPAAGCPRHPGAVTCSGTACLHRSVGREAAQPAISISIINRYHREDLSPGVLCL